MAKRILHITAHLGGGAGKAIGGMIENCEEFENTVVVLEMPEDTRWYEICETAGAKLLVSSKAADVVREIEKADVVVLNWWAHPLTVNLLTLLDNVEARYVIWAHVNGLSFPVLTPEFLNEFESVMLTSPCYLDSADMSYVERNTLNNKTEFVYGIGNFHPAEFDTKETYATTDIIRIGYIGTMDFAKMSSDFPEICSRVAGKMQNVQFELCGKYSEDFEKAFFKEHPELRKNVLFSGFVTDVKSRLLTFDVFAYPLSKNNYATTENAILEAMAAGLPVAVYNNPAERAIIENEVNGVTAETPAAFADRIIDLCRDEHEREKIGKAARAHVIAKYDARVNGDRFKAAIENALKVQKHYHNFSQVTGKDIWERFLFFSGDDREKIEAFLRGENIELPAIFRSESKSSPKHYLRYFNDDRMAKLETKIGQINQ